MYCIMYICIIIPVLHCGASVALRSKRSQKSGENYEELTLIRFKVFQSVARHDNVL